MGCCLLSLPRIMTTKQQVPLLKVTAELAYRECIGTVLLLKVTVELAYRECIGTLLQGRTGAAASLVCPLCRAKVQGQELVKGVNEDAQALEEEDSFAASLEQKASTSESKLMVLLEEVTAYLSSGLSSCLSSLSVCLLVCASVCVCVISSAPLDEHASTDVCVCPADGSVIRECRDEKEYHVSLLRPLRTLAHTKRIVRISAIVFLAVAQCHALQQALRAVRCVCGSCE